MPRQVKTWTLLGLMFLAISCQTAPSKEGPSFYYVTPLATYLRNCPKFDCQVLVNLYKGDQVEVLEEQEQGWWRVRLSQGGEAGWIPSKLLSSSPVQAENYYVTLPVLPLKECPGEECPSRKQILQGETVRKIDQNEQGWWRVLVQKDLSLGWIPATAVSENKPEEAKVPRPDKPHYFVAVANLNLYLLPLTSSQVVKTFNLNEELEKLEQTSKDWIKVRQVSTGAEGWVQARNLREQPVPPDKPVVKKKRKRHPKPAPAPAKAGKEEPPPPPDQEETPPQPEAM